MNQEPMTAQQAKPKRFAALLDRHFHLTERNTTAKSEIGAGISIFFISICFLLVNTRIIGNATSETTYSFLYFGTALVSMLSSIVLGLVCNLPLTLSANMGLSSLLVSCLGTNTGLTYSNLLFLNFIAAAVYLLLFATPLYHWLLKAIPDCVLDALPVAVGALLVLQSLQRMGYLSIDSSNVFSLFSLSSLSGIDDAHFAGFLVSCLTLVLYFCLRYKGAKKPFLTSFLVGTLLFFLVAISSRSMSAVYALNRLWFVGSEDAYTIARAFKEAQWFSLFSAGTDFSAFSSNGGNLPLLVSQMILLFLLSGIFESSAASRAALATNSFVKEGDSRRIFLVAAAANTLAPLVGVAPLSVSKESEVGAVDGAKTGLASLVSGFGFFIALFTWAFYVFFATWTDSAVEWYYGHYGQCMSYYVSAEFALADVVMLGCGIEMLTGLRKCKISDPAMALPFILTVIASVISMNLVFGAAIGVLSYLVFCLLSFKKETIKTLTIPSLVAAAIFVVYLILMAL